MLAISGPNGEPMATPSICLYKSLEELVYSCDCKQLVKLNLTNVKVVCVVKPVPIECFLR